MGLVAKPVFRLLGGGAVVAQAVGLDDQAEVGPVEVDVESVELDLRLGLGQADAAADRPEALLELRVGERERAEVEQLTQQGEVDQGAGGGRDRDPVMASHILGAERGSSVHLQPRSASRGAVEG